MNDKKSLEEPLNPQESNHHEIVNSIDVEPGDNELPNLSRKGSSKVNIDAKPSTDSHLNLSRKNSSKANIESEKELFAQDNLDNLDNNNENLPEGGQRPRRVYTPEDRKLGGHAPLVTLFRLCVGPLLSQVTNALFGIITTIWISKACGTDGLSAVSMMNAFDGIGRSFGFFLAIAASTQISFLFGKGRSSEAGQIIADLIRMSFVCGAFTAAVLIPILRPISVWFGADETIIQLGIKYMLPLNICAFSSCLFIASGGFLQGEGRTFLFGMSNVTCLVLNMAILDPIFLFVFKMGISGASTATIFSELVPMSIIITLFYCHKFGVKPELNQLLKKFSPNTWPALKVGFSSLIAQLSGSIPSIVVRKYMGLAAGNNPEDFANVMAGFNAAIRINNLTFSIFMAISQSFIPAASYAFAAKRYKRFLMLAFHMLWLCSAWGLLTSIMTWSIPRQLAMIFSKEEGYLKYAERMVRYNNALGPIMSVKMVAQSMLQSLQRGPRATILSFFNNFMTIIIFNFVLYYTNKHDGARIIWCYPLAHAAACVISPFFLWGPLKNIYNLMKTEDAEAEYENMNEEVEKEEKEQKINMPRKPSVIDVMVKVCDVVEDPSVHLHDDDYLNNIKKDKKKFKKHRTMGDIEHTIALNENKTDSFPRSDEI